MAEIPLHSEEYGEITLAPDMNCLIVRWHGFANSRNLRFLLNKALALYLTYSGRYANLALLSDTRYFGAVLTVDQEWVNTDWNPRAYAAGIRQVNFLAPANVFGQIALQHYTQNTARRTDYQLAVRYYTSLEEASRSLSAL